MKLFKNEVGRPSNETLKKRRIFIAIICAVVLVAIIGTVYLLSGSNLSRLRGDGAWFVENKRYSAGDINGDRKGTLKDIELLLNHVYGIKNTKALKAANADNVPYYENSKINMDDIIWLIKA